MTDQTIVQIIPVTSKQIQKTGTVIETVNARDLHEFLEVGRFFSNWIKGRIKEYGFQENQDFVSFAEIGKRDKGATVRIEYHLSLDMAKELSMVERTEKGRQARQYFIRCEKELRKEKKYTRMDFIEPMSRAQGLREGILLSRSLDKHGLDLADVAKICWYRRNNLTQKETAKLFDIEYHKMQDIEKTLKSIGIPFPTIIANKRAKEMRDQLDGLLGYAPEGLHLVTGGV